MRRSKDISSDYFKADREDRFEYLYDHYRNREGVLLAQKHNFIYLVEGLMMRSNWEGYCKNYNSLSRKATMKRISGCMDRGEAFDFISEGIILPEDLMQRYKNYCLMKLEFRILSEAMRSIGGADESILRRYIAGEMTLWDVADERHVSYETAKGRIRDLKKKLKTQAIAFFTEEAMIS